MSAQQQLACQAKQIECWLPERNMQMAALIAIFVKIAGVSMTCANLQALALQYSCLDRSLQLPALIALAVEIVSNGGGGGSGQPQVFTGVGHPTISPVAPTALYVDTSVPGLWYWSNSVWQPIIE